MSDESIEEKMELLAIGKRDQEAFANWLGRSEESIRLSLRSFARSVDVEAVVQETALRAWQVASMLEPDGKPNVLLRWAVTVARNLARDSARRSGREFPLEGDENVPELPTVAPSDPMLAERIEICLGKLKGKPADALAARLWAGGTDSDRKLAEGISMTFDNFRKNLSRARMALEVCLERFGIQVRTML